MAIKLAERAVDGVWAMMRNYLGTELQAVYADRGDTISLPAPAPEEFYKREMPLVAGVHAAVEVYDTRGIQFVQSQQALADARASYHCFVAARATIFNRYGSNGEVMELRRRRYQAAMFNVIAKRPTQLNADPALQLGWIVESLDPAIERDEDGAVLKVQTTQIIEVVCEETQA